MTSCSLVVGVYQCFLALEPPARKRCMVNLHLFCLVNLLQRTDWNFASVLPFSGRSACSLIQLARRYRLPIRSISFWDSFPLIFPVEWVSPSLNLFWAAGILIIPWIRFDRNSSSSLCTYIAASVQDHDTHRAGQTSSASSLLHYISVNWTVEQFLLLQVSH
jgi:hypothetical protein